MQLWLLSAPAVASMRSSLALLDSSISILDEGVSDFPRLCKVLQTQQHFELVPEPTLRDAQQSLVDEIAPAISQLLSTSENYINQLGRKEESLQAKSEAVGRTTESQQEKFQPWGRFTSNAQYWSQPRGIAQRRKSPGNEEASTEEKNDCSMLSNDWNCRANKRRGS